MRRISHLPDASGNLQALQGDHFVIRKAFLDVDGVLNKLILYAMQFVGCDIPLDDSAFKSEWGWNMLLGVEHYTGKKMTDDEFWGQITQEIWRTAPLSDECWPIIERLERLVGRENIVLLTATPHCKSELMPPCIAGKLQWIQEQMPPWLHNQFFIGPQKWHVGRYSDALLIDDGDHNIRDFIKAGGRAIRVPRPWNCDHDLPTLDAITMRLDELIYRGEGR
jgi:hypothetical protein